MTFIVLLYTILWVVVTFTGGMLTSVYSRALKEKDKQGNFLFTLLLLEFWGAYAWFFKDYKFDNIVLIIMGVAFLLGIAFARKLYKK